VDHNVREGERGGRGRGNHLCVVLAVFPLLAVIARMQAKAKPNGGSRINAFYLLIAAPAWYAQCYHDWPGGRLEGAM